MPVGAQGGHDLVRRFPRRSGDDHGFRQCGAQRLQHELDEDRGIGSAIRCGHCRVIVRLLPAHHGLDRQTGQQWLPLPQDQCLPQSAHAAIALLQLDHHEFQNLGLIADQLSD